jgi:translation initiation factor IF-3
MPTREALELAVEKKLDLVEVAANAQPPVCRIMDYGKFKYDKEKKAKEAKKKQKVVVVKEVKFKPRIDTHDRDTKIGKIEKFLAKEYKIKVSLMLFGRERMHTDLGIRLLDEIASQFAETAIVEKKYNEAQKFLMISPLKKDK